MKLKLYTIASILLIIAVSVYAYIFFGETVINHKLFTVELALPIYIWVVVPMIIIFLLSLMHMIYYSIKIKLELSRWHKDSLNLQDTLNAILIGKNKRFNIKHQELNSIAQALENAKIEVQGDLASVSSDNKLLENLNLNKTISSGGYVKLSKSGYDTNSKLLMQNHLNRLDSDIDFAKQVLKSKENYAQKVIDKAIVDYAAKMEPKELKPFYEMLNQKALEVLIKRVKEGSFKIDKEDAKLLYDKCDTDLLYPFTKAVKAQFEPDQTLSFFKELYEKDERAKELYIYLLLEFEMTDKASEILVEEPGFDHFRAYLELIEAGKRYPLSLFVK